jgi:hypothetical protein
MNNMGKLKGWIIDTIGKMQVDDGTTRTVFDEQGYLYQRNTKLTASGADLNATSAVVLNQAIKAVSSASKACAVNGLNIVAVGTGLADATLAAPTVGARCVIRIGSLSSGTCVVTCASGVTLNGTQTIATFDAVNDTLTLIYKAANTWEVESNIGAVVLS